VFESDETFTVIGDDRGMEFLDLGMGGPGNIGTYDEVLYAATSPDSWEVGERVGQAHAFFVVTPDGHAMVTLTLEFDGDEGPTDSLTAHGALGREGPDFRTGVLTVGGGTGRMKHRTGQLRVESRNPHKYSFS
jgi:hypothetical protein